MITEAQYAAATVLFTTIAGRDRAPGKDEAFALYRQCLRAVLEGPAASSGRQLDLKVDCSACGEKIDVSVVVD